MKTSLSVELSYRQSPTGSDTVNSLKIQAVSFKFHLSSSFHSTEASVAERYLGSVVDQQEHYVLSKTDNHINLIKNDTLLLVDSFPFNPVQHLQSIRFSNQMIDAGIRFEHKVNVHQFHFEYLFEGSFIGFSDLLSV